MPNLDQVWIVMWSAEFGGEKIASRKLAKDHQHDERQHNILDCTGLSIQFPGISGTLLTTSWTQQWLPRYPPTRNSTMTLQQYALKASHPFLTTPAMITLTNPQSQVSAPKKPSSQPPSSPPQKPPNAFSAPLQPRNSPPPSK